MKLQTLIQSLTVISIYVPVCPSQTTTLLKLVGHWQKHQKKNCCTVAAALLLFFSSVYASCSVFQMNSVFIKTLLWIFDTSREKPVPLLSLYPVRHSLYACVCVCVCESGLHPPAHTFIASLFYFSSVQHFRGTTGHNIMTWQKLAPIKFWFLWILCF